MTEANHHPLHGVIGEAVSLLRTSDTFKWLTGDAAGQLAQPHS